MWLSELVTAWNEGLDLLATPANHALTRAELSTLAPKDMDSLRALAYSGACSADSARYIAIYLLCRALAGRIGTTSTKHKRLVLSKFNPLIFSLTRVERFCETLPELIVMPAPDGIPKESDLIASLQKWDINLERNDGRLGRSSLLLTNCTPNLAFSIKKAWPNTFTTTASQQTVASFFDGPEEFHWLTIVIPTLGGAPVQRALDSIFEQQATGIKVLVVPKGTGETENVQRSRYPTTCAATQFQTSFLSTSDLGVYDAMNFGVAICDTPWIYFMGDDDELAATGVLATIQSEVAKAEPTNSVIYGNVEIEGDGHGTYDGQVYGYLFDYSRLRFQNPCHQAIFYKTELLRTAQGFNLTYPVCADWDLNLRIWLKANPRFIDLVIANFRRGGISSTHSDSAFTRRREQIWKKHKKLHKKLTLDTGKPLQKI